MKFGVFYGKLEIKTRMNGTGERMIHSTFSVFYINV